MPRFRRPALQALLKDGVTDTFNAVTIDGDTSTSDTLMMFATGKRRAPRIARAADPRLKAFKKALQQVLANLAEQVARDGEGARKLVEIVVEGAVSKAPGAAHRAVDRQFAAGEDRDCRRGRQLGPRGDGGGQGRRAGRPRQALDLVRRHPRRHKGARDPGYDEAAVSAEMKKPEIYLKVALGLGKGRDRVLTCDLTKEYVAINGDYRS